MTGTSGSRTGRAGVLIADDGPALDEVLSVAVLDGVLPDGVLPDPDGLQALRRARFENPRPPVLPLAACDALEHRLPLEEAVLRLRAPLRRAGSEHTRTDESVRVVGVVGVVGDLVLTADTREVRRAGVPVQLTAKEFDPLSLLLEHPRQVLSKAQILGHVRSGSFDDDGGHLVEVCDCGLRRTIDRGRAPVIHTVRGLGYALRAAEDGR